MDPTAGMGGEEQNVDVKDRETVVLQDEDERIDRV